MTDVYQQASVLWIRAKYGYIPDPHTKIVFDTSSHGCETCGWTEMVITGKRYGGGNFVIEIDDGTDIATIVREVAEIAAGLMAGTRPEDAAWLERISQEVQV